MLSIKPILHQNRAIIPYHSSSFFMIRQQTCITAFNSAIVICFARSTATATCCWCCQWYQWGPELGHGYLCQKDYWKCWNVDGKLDTPLLKGREALVGWWRRVSCRSRFVCASPRSTRMTSRSTAKNISLSKYINYSKSNKGLFKYQWFIMEQMKNNTEQLN